MPRWAGTRLAGEAVVRGSGAGVRSAGCGPIENSGKTAPGCFEKKQAVGTGLTEIRTHTHQVPCNSPD